MVGFCCSVRLRIHEMDNTSLIPRRSMAFLIYLVWGGPLVLLIHAGVPAFGGTRAFGVLDSTKVPSNHTPSPACHAVALA